VHKYARAREGVQPIIEVLVIYLELPGLLDFTTAKIAALRGTANAGHTEIICASSCLSASVICGSICASASVSRSCATLHLYFRILPLCVDLSGRGDEFLEARIIPERIEHRIESEQRRSERQVFVQCARARYREHLL
jgi:hypothetical protein